MKTITEFGGPAVAISGLPSPLKSPIVTEYGSVPPCDKSILEEKVAVDAPGVVVFK